jgi:hypothetical protein
MKRSIYLGGLAALVLASACSKIPGLGKLGGGGGNGSGGAAAAPVPAVTPTPTVDDEAPYELRILATRAKTLEGYAETQSDDQMRKQIPEVESAIATARAKFPDRDYQPYEKLIADAEAAIEAIERNRQASADDAKRSMQVREELEAQVRGIDTRLTPSAQDAVAYLERYRAVAERCQREGLAGLSTAIAELCKTAAGPHRFAGPAADEALAEVDGDLDTMEQAKVPQAAKGEVWFDNGKTGFLDVVAWVEPRLAQIDRLATAGGVTADTASRRARATQLATAFADALAAAAKKDAMPKGLITSPTITETAVNWIDDDGKVIRAGVEKASVRSVKNDFGVVTGKSGNGWAVYQPPDKPYCYLRGFEAYAEADGRRWQLSSRGKVEMLRVTRCK